MVFLMNTFLFAATPFTDEAGIEAAIAAQTKAYCPYSEYPVGAALIGASGMIYQGCNVENASYGLCICAERNAVFQAVAQGEKQFQAIFIATKDGGISCGACRQVLYEFSPSIRIVTLNGDGQICYDTSLDRLLPHAFGPSNLQ